ncbi:dihydrodipicolinate synthase family protein [Tepidanaerobacter syntrophicus]|uniref:4-hydroxy-tetrahydrodipicolinate synthase n=1 Tax=Tepidanaerobacter syntrophicus TaxID=224999 RepID=A0A0U9HM46_9FIRM|nr:dihydrodipicolinate synthase family protein [Tepidanaerobacter syntrophicus]GAQ25151.1 4-hydroxy-tetrahydrodipicolinate synthase [Tepidanaerobacter syntrophicus]
MKAIDFKGIIPPLMTPFTETGEIYEDGLKRLIDFVVPYVQGLYPVGTYGSGPLMSIQERKKAAELIIEYVNGRVPVIIHVGTADTNTTVELAKHAESIGADAVGAIAPYYNPLTDDSIFEHFRCLIDAVNIPVFVYNNPSISGNPIKPEVLKKLADYGLRGIKDSSFDLVNYYNYKLAVEDYQDFNVIIGTEAIFYAAFEAGAIGAVTGLGNIFPELLNKMYLEYINGKKEEAKKTQELVLKLRSVTKLGPTVPVMHAILEMRGIDSGYPRKPFLPISEELKVKVKSSLEELKLL